jgi:hypothetical protein
MSRTPQVQLFPMHEANWALNALKNDAVRGAAVLAAPQTL